MPSLKLGVNSPRVTLLKDKLRQSGFDPSSTGPVFDQTTDTAVRKFQASRGLVVDGDVGPATKLAVGMVTLPASPPDVTSSVTAAKVIAVFPSATPAANIRKHLPNVLPALSAAGLGDRDMVLMALATIRAESEGFEPIDEGISHFNTDPGGPPFARYDDRLGNRGPGEGARFKGRGFVQLTGRANYTKYGTKLALDLVGDPERANDSKAAGLILAAFLKDAELRVRVALAEKEMGDARMAVNGGVHGLDRFTDTFRRGEQNIT